MASRKLKHYTVEGQGYFPLDMLRYDCSWPTTSEDVNNLLVRDPDRDSMRNPEYVRQSRRVQLSTWSEGAPTIGRWQSFGWRITHIEGRAL